MAATPLNLQKKLAHEQPENYRPVWCWIRAALWTCLILASFAGSCQAQYKADDTTGFLGLSNGTQPPPGLYLGSLAWVYPPDTVKDNNGNSVPLPGSLTSTAEIILVNVVTPYKFLGANIGASAGFPFISNRIQTDSLDVRRQPLPDK
jgi:hypothetical protein